MRKLSYVLTFAAVAATLFLNILSVRRPDWLVVKYSSDVIPIKVTYQYGLNQLCELRISKVGGGKVTYKDYECRKFPARVADRCEKENSTFCAMWTSAGYVDELAIGFGAVSLLAILFGVSTHSRRRRIWRAVAGLVLFQAVCQLVTFSIITDEYRTSHFIAFEKARPGIAYVLNTVSWIFSLLVGLTVIITGIAADKGHHWAAGNRAYHPIEG